ncbi:MAG: stress response translation initiation inhibitor YciH [Candidatus Eremiobacteraeota bacterium]|nr:stress response translation initiation inhibitor YciH [Candidatus Eremiobacteraeota bacterium]
MKDDRRLVYSSDGGRQSGRPTPKAAVAGRKSQIPDDGVIRVWRERRRAGTLTRITGLASAELQTVATTLKNSCATGGTAKNGVVELQGDHRDKVIAFFEKQNRRVKRAGG